MSYFYITNITPLVQVYQKRQFWSKVALRPEIQEAFASEH